MAIPTSSSRHSADESSSIPVMRQIILHYTEEGDGFSSDGNCKLAAVVIPISEPLTAMDILKALYDDQADIKVLQAIRFFAPFPDAQGLPGKEGGWILLKKDSQFPAHSGAALRLRLCRGARAVWWISAAIRQFENPDPLEFSDLPSADPPPPPLDFERLKSLGTAIESQWGLDVAIPLLRGLKSLTLTTWKRAKPSGILFHGPPGTGKSSLCQLLMGCIPEGNSYVLFSGVAAQLNEKYVGEAEKRLKSLTEAATAEPDALFLLFIDEVHGLAKRQTGASNASHSGQDSKQDLLLSLLEVMTAYPNIMFLFATNFLATLDPAFLRSKRIDLQILVPPLSFAQRSTYYKTQLMRYLKPLLQSDVPDGASLEQLERIRQEAFALITTNFSLAQFAVLKDRIQTEVQFGGDRNLDTFWRYPRPTPVEKIDASRFLLHIRDVAIYGSESSKKFTQSVLIPTAGPDDDFQAWIAQTREIAKRLNTQPTGRKVVFAPSGYVAVEGPTTTSELAFWKMPIQQDERSVGTVLHNFLIALHPINSVHVIDGEFRNKFQDYLDEALDAVYTECYQQTSSVIIIEMDDIIGLVPESSAFTMTCSLTAGESAGQSQQRSIGFSDTWNFTSSVAESLGRSTARSVSLSEGTSASSSTSSSVTLSQNAQATATLGHSFGQSKNWGTNVGYSTNRSFGHSEGSAQGSSLSSTTSSGFSAGIGLSGPSLGFSGGSSQTTSNFNSFNRSWSDTTGFGDSWGSAKGSAVNSGSSTSSATTTGLSEANTSGHGSASSTNSGTSVTGTSGVSSTKTETESAATGGSVSSLAAFSINASSNKSESVSTSQATTLRMQYPKAAHSITRLLNRINRAEDGRDPHVIVVYRVTEPPVLSALPSLTSESGKMTPITISLPAPKNPSILPPITT